MLSNHWPFPYVNGEQTEESKAVQLAKHPTQTPYEKAIDQAEEAPL